MDYLQTKGRIFDIQRFSIHDGVGIRTIVFFKGCMLRCRWCCNPESQNHDIETMFIQGKAKTVGKDVTVEEVMDIVLKDRPYYRRSGGGLTLSGGEILFQPNFAANLLKAAKISGLNTAVESTGNAPFSQIEKLLPYIDQYLLDIKHINSVKHKEYTGVENSLILENAVKISNSDKTELIIRVPVIEGFNDSKEEIKDIAVFAGKLGIKTLHLLPYHAYGTDKYKGLNREYLMGNISPPTDKHLESLKEIAENNSPIKVKIGG